MSSKKWAGSSVFWLPYTKRYYLIHPIKFVKDIIQIGKDVYRRARYGWTWQDVWNWDTWFLATTPDMLDYLAEHGVAYPGKSPFETPEKWHDWLHLTAKMLRTGSDKWQRDHNEYYEGYSQYLADNWPQPYKDENGVLHQEVPKPNDTTKKYYAHADELHKLGCENIEFAMKEIGKYFHDIWD